MEVSSQLKKTLGCFVFYCEGGQTLEQVSQRGLLSNFGDIKNLTEWRPEQPAVSDPA